MQKQQQTEKRLNNSQNLANVESEAKENFAELISEVKNSLDEERTFKIKDKNKSKILEYYAHYIKEQNSIKGYAFVSYAVIVAYLSYDKFFAKMTNNYTFDTAVQSVGLFIFFALVTVYFLSEYNIERFFLHLYPSFPNEEKAGDIATALRESIFNNYQKREIGIRKILTLSIVLIIIEVFIFITKGNFVNLNIAGLMCFAMFCVLHRKQNSVMKFI